MQKRYSPIEIKALLSKIIIPEKGKQNIDFSVKSGLQIATGYTRLQTSPFGVYVEFDLKQMYMPILYFSTQDNPYFFVWSLDNNPEVEVLQPRYVFESTNFLQHYFYVDPKDLYTHGMSLLKKEKICLKTLQTRQTT